MQRPLEVRPTLGEALLVYRLLFRRSVAVAAAVYSLDLLLQVAHHTTAGAGAAFLAFVLFLFELAGPLLVQGALVAIVRDIHEGEAPQRLGPLFDIGWQRFWPLLGASLLYAFGIAFGLVLLVVPGLIVAARWSLMAPAIVLEGKDVGEARRRSNSLVEGSTFRVFACLELLFLLTGGVGALITFSGLSFAAATLATFAWSTLTAPLWAHTLTVIYYRLAEPARPVVDPVVRTWESVWEGR